MTFCFIFAVLVVCHAHLGVVLWSWRSRGPSSMSVPNFKRIALSHAHFGVILWSRRSMGPSSISMPNLKQILGHVTPGHAHFGVALSSGRSRGPSSMFVPNLKRIALFFQKLSGGSQNFEFGSRDPKQRPHWGHSMIRTQYGPVLYICAKFEADISIRSKVIRGSQNFEIWSRDLGHAHLGVLLWSGRSRGPSSISVPNLKQISPFVQKL